MKKNTKYHCYDPWAKNSYSVITCDLCDNDRVGFIASEITKAEETSEPCDHGIEGPRKCQACDKVIKKQIIEKHPEACFCSKACAEEFQDFLDCQGEF